MQFLQYQTKMPPLFCYNWRKLIHQCVFVRIALNQGNTACGSFLFAIGMVGEYVFKTYLCQVHPAIDPGWSPTADKRRSVPHTTRASSTVTSSLQIVFIKALSWLIFYSHTIMVATNALENHRLRNLHCGDI